MKVYAYSKARQRFATILECARREGAVGIRSKDGQVFVLRPETPPSASPWTCPALTLTSLAIEIVALVREGRRKP